MEEALAEVAIAVITIVIGVHQNEMIVLGPEITTIAAAEEEEVTVVAAEVEVEVEVEGVMAAEEEEVRSIH